MNMRMIVTILLTVLLLGSTCGCASAGRTLDAMEDAAENRLDVIEETAKSKIQEALDLTEPETALTRHDAQSIALKHAGLTADQVTNLRTEYDIDDGVPEYHVEFNYGGQEYEYEIHAQTGDILSLDRDN